MKINLPAQDVPIQIATGIDPVWYERLKRIETFLNLFSEVNVSTLTNGQVLIWDATQKKFLPGAN
jgi:hypothetical protein